MLIACPGCGAQESHCREVLPACRRLAADRRRLYASANGGSFGGGWDVVHSPRFAGAILRPVLSEVQREAMDHQRVVEDAVLRATAPLRDENARLRAEIRRLQAEATVPGRRA